MPHSESTAPDTRLSPWPTAVEETPFLRLWHGFLTGRVMVALALVSLQALGQWINGHSEPLVLAVCAAYLLATLVLRVWARHAPPAPEAGAHWLPTIGVDLAAVGLLQWLHSGGMNFSALLGLPIFLGAVLGSLTLALGTTAAATLMLLGWAWWLGQTSSGDPAQRYLQAALTGTGYFIIAFLVHQLSTRLVREQRVAQHNRRAARVQRQVSTLVIENLSDGVLVVDDNDHIRMANPAALRLLECPDGLRTPFWLGYHPAWLPLQALAAQTFAQGTAHSADISLQPLGNSPIGLRVRSWLTPVAASPDWAQERLCVMFLHDLRELEARLRTEKLAAMGRMSAAVAHEIRNPLAAIMQANALLAEDLQDATSQRMAQMVQQNAERIARTVEDILDIARVRHQPRHTPADTLLVDDAIATTWHDWCAQDLQRRQGILCLQATGWRVEFDGEHLRRVLVNLLDNAQRYRSAALDGLQLHSSVSPSGEVCIEVWSDGAPMDQSVEKHLFEPFFSSESRSSGLGLYICRELCERHGATLSYQRSSQNTADGERQGNTFSVVLRALAA